MRFALFLSLFAGICTAAGWVDGLAVPRPADSAVATVAGTDPEAVERRRAEDTIHNAIAAVAAVGVATAFLAIVGTYRRHPDGGRCGADGSVDVSKADDVPIPTPGGTGLGTGRHHRAGLRAGLGLTPPALSPDALESHAISAANV